MIIGLPILAALVAYVASTTQSSVYRAKADVLINLSSAAAASTGTSDPSNGDPLRFLTTQASIARSPELALRVVRAARAAGAPAMSPGGFLGESSAEPRIDANILNLSVSDPNPADAVTLVSVYAREFTSFKKEVDTANINDALRENEQQLKLLRDQGLTGSATYDKLLEKNIDLRTDGPLLADNTKVLQVDEGATKVRPTPRRNALIGALLGAFLGLGLAFLAEALDKRVRSEHEIEEALGLPLLGRLPRPSRRLRNTNTLVMLAEPRSVHAETFRRLRTGLEFVNFGRPARTIMITSAGPREGKSTTVANLAVALARAGRRVALVDLDLRRPFLHTFFGVRHDHGFTDVVVGRVDLAEAVRPVALTTEEAREIQRDNGRRIGLEEHSGSNGRSNTSSVMHLLPSGTIPPSADEFLERGRVSSVLEELSSQFDVVLVDAPPLLAVGDVMTLSTMVDAIVVVTHLSIHRRQLHELARQLQNCRAAILGCVITGVSHGDSYSYGYGYDPHVYDARQEAERRGQPV